MRWLAQIVSHRLRVLVCLSFGFALGASAKAGSWTTAYYPGYRQSFLPLDQIDFTALTHIVHFSVLPNSDSTLNATANGLNAAHSSELISRAHAAGCKVIVCVGGSDSETGFQGATSPANLAAFISGIVQFMTANGYDGVDLDWEPLSDNDTEGFANLVSGLRVALDDLNPRPLLTAATVSQPALFAQLQDQLDQINLMTYDLAGPWSGWVTWFNAPIFDGGYRFPSNGKLIPSGNGIVTNFIGNQVSPGKLGMGLCFYGRLWTDGAGTSTGGTLLPRQSWTNAPTVTALSFDEIMSKYYQAADYHWDNAAQAAYLSISNPIATNDIFLSYDDEYACQAKISYARNQHLGGVMIWELSQGYRATAPVGQRDPLLQAVRQALATPGPLSIELAGLGIQLSFSGAPLALYRVLWTSDLNGGIWTTLADNVPGTNGMVVVSDPAEVAIHSPRFYRVQTPP
jgi:chitinase